MAFEKRGKRTYLYRSYRDEQGRVRKRYLGRAQDAAAMARAEAVEFLAQRAAAKKRAAILCATEPLEKTTALLGEVVDDMVRAEMTAAGFHYHRGSWRKKRVQPDKR